MQHTAHKTLKNLSDNFTLKKNHLLKNNWWRTSKNLNKAFKIQATIQQKEEPKITSKKEEAYPAHLRETEKQVFPH